MSEIKPMTDAQMRILRTLQESHFSLSLPPSRDRAELVKRKLIVSRPMNVGHRRQYGLSPAGHKLLTGGGNA